MKKTTLIPGALLLASLSAATTQVATLASPSKVAHTLPLTVATSWEMVYEHDTAGVPISGSLSDLVDAAQAGAEIKIGPSPASGVGATGPFYTLDQVEVFSLGGVMHVGGQYEGLSLIDQIGPLNIRSNPYRAYVWIDSDGGSALARHSFVNNANLGNTVGVRAGTWFVRR
ncbi:MAG: hypothetical protein KUG81_05250 [Gammaproteobacteria bacterium]|nr:hypothetical protein [Gammaproteobacteria bacterium]